MKNHNKNIRLNSLQKKKKKKKEMKWKLRPVINTKKKHTHTLFIKKKKVHFKQGLKEDDNDDESGKIVR